MKLITINNNNLKLLYDFTQNKLPNTFRYFNSRSINIIKNHIVTIVGIVDELPIAYGHIDNEYNINWLGICVLKEFHGNGYGKKILNYLINYIYSNNISNIQLSVDIDNYIAINLYLKNKFKIQKINKTNYIMTLNKSIELPVSIGEALDKLTILDIKMKKITDQRKSDVEKEFLLLNSQLDEYKNKYIFFYDILVNINEEIWDMQDLFRATKDNQQQNKLCIKIIQENDNRFRVKKKINNLTNSDLKEQKGYIPKTAFVLSHLGLGDNIIFIGAVRYLSTCYDKVIVVCKNINVNNVKLFYSDDSDIEMFTIDHHLTSSSIIINQFKEKYKNHLNPNNLDIYTCGPCQIINKTAIPVKNNIPFNFYMDCNIDYKYFWKYFYIPESVESKELFNKLNTNYLFIHNIASTGEVFTINYIEKNFNIDRNKILIINPNKNLYNQEHQFYNLAQIFINLPLIYYVDTIINADKLFLTDSSFLCLSLNLSIKTKNCYYYSRGNSYSHLFKDEILLKKLNKPIFQSIK